MINRQTRTGFAFLSLSLAGVAVFLLLPYLDVFRRAFFRNIDGSFAGLSNFQQTIDNEAFQLALKNTSLFVLACIPLLLAISLAIALFIYNSAKQGPWLKTGFLVPMAIPAATIVLVWQFIFAQGGFVNKVLDSFGISGPDWMNTKAAFWVLVFSYLWKNTGYQVVLWLGGLAGISQDLYEAAVIDGAGPWQQFRYITLPNLLPSFFVISVLALLNSFKVFREAYLVAGEYPHDRMYLLQHLYNNWFRDLAVDKMAAAAVLNSVVLILLILLLEKFWNKKE